MINKKELFIVVVILVILGAFATPVLFDSGHNAYLKKSQQLLLDQGDVIVVCKAEQEGDHVNYRLIEIWRNRNNDEIDWTVDDS